VLLAVPVLLLTGCGEEQTTGSGSAGSAGPPPAGSTSQGVRVDDETVLRVTAEVIHAHDEDTPRLCHAVMESYPPQCGGWPVLGLDWSQLPPDAYEEAAGVRWGRFELTGTWDGERLTLTAPAVPAGRPGHVPEPPQDEVTTPCPAPDGGWTAVDPEKADGPAREAVIERAHRMPGFAGVWIDGVGGSGGEVLNLRFTGDPAEREAELRQLWGGPLCLASARHTYEELLAVQEALHEEFGADVIGSGVDEPGNTVSATAAVASRELVAALEERFGAGVVVLSGMLTPVEDTGTGG
jgi:hypothetical protein